MNIEAYIPTELLRPFVKSYLIIESNDELINRVLPDTSLTIAFRYKGQVNYIVNKNLINLPTSVVSGLRGSVRLINYTKDTGNVLVIFKEASAIAFFREPLNELFNESISLDNFISQQKISRLEEQLAEAKNNNRRIVIVEQFLLSKLHDSRIDKLITAAMQRIHAAKGIIKIKELAHSLYASQDAFEKRFRKTVGASPKQFSSIVRMKSIINERTKKDYLTDIALEAGYFDQSHFNKDFKFFTGQTPTDFFKSLSFW